MAMSGPSLTPMESRRAEENSKPGRLPVSLGLSGLPVEACMDRDSGNNKAEKAKGKWPGIRAGEVEEVTADPCAERAAQTEAHFEITEDQPYLPARKNIADDRAVGGSSSALTDAEQYRGEISKPYRGSGQGRDQARHSY